MEKKPFYKKWWVWLIVVVFVIGVIGSGEEAEESDAGSEQNESSTGNIDLIEGTDPTFTDVERDETGRPVSGVIQVDEESVEEEAQEENEVDPLESIREFKGEMTLDVAENKITMNITSNVPNGGLFEIMIMDNQFNTESNVVAIKDGKIVHDFSTEKFDVGYISGLAQFRFNLEDHPQPDEIKEIYGENGELMTGDRILENNHNGYNGALENITVAYPDEKTVANKANELFSEAINEIISISEGVIVDIRPRDDAWRIVDVIVSDAWYYSAEHVKERFADQIGSTITTIVHNSGRNDSIVRVYFKDTFGEELASPKLLGGYKIKK